MRLFNDESLLMRILGRAADLLWINILTLICSIPIVTAGASLTAMHSVLLQMVRNEEGYLTRSFFKAFCGNFRQATVIWVMLLSFFLVFVADLYLFGLTDTAVPEVFKALLIVTAFFMLCVSTMVFPFLARFENTVMNTMKNAVLFTLGQFPRILLMLLMGICSPVLLFLLPKAIPLVLLFGISVPSYGAAVLYDKPFTLLEKRIQLQEGRTETGETSPGRKTNEDME